MPATIFSMLCRVPASWPPRVDPGVELNRLAAPGVVEEVVEAMAAAMAPCMACRANWALSSRGLNPGASIRPGGGAIEYGGVGGTGGPNVERQEGLRRPGWWWWLKSELLFRAILKAEVTSISSSLWAGKNKSILVNKKYKTQKIRPKKAQEIRYVPDWWSFIDQSQKCNFRLVQHFKYCNIVSVH